MMGTNFLNSLILNTIYSTKKFGIKTRLPNFSGLFYLVNAKSDVVNLRELNITFIILLNSNGLFYFIVETSKNPKPKIVG